MIVIYKKNITKEIPESELANWEAQGWCYNGKKRVAVAAEVKKPEPEEELSDSEDSTQEKDD